MYIIVILSYYLLHIEPALRSIDFQGHLSKDNTTYWGDRQSWKPRSPWSVRYAVLHSEYGVASSRAIRCAGFSHSFITLVQEEVFSA